MNDVGSESACFDFRDDLMAEYDVQRSVGLARNEWGCTFMIIGNASSGVTLYLLSTYCQLPGILIIEL